MQNKITPSSKQFSHLEKLFKIKSFIIQGLPEDKQRLIYEGKQLEDGKSVAFKTCRLYI